MLIAQDLMSDSRRGEEIDPRSLDIDGNIIRYADRKEIVEMTDGEGNPWPDDAPLYKDPVTGQEEPLYMDRFHTISCNVTDMSQPWMEYDWNEKTQEYEVQRVIHFDTDYDLASFTLLPDGVTAEELIASSPTWQKAVEAIRVSDPSGGRGGLCLRKGPDHPGPRHQPGGVPRRRGGVPDLRVSVPGKRAERGGYPAAVAV